MEGFRSCTARSEQTVVLRHSGRRDFFPPLPEVSAPPPSDNAQSIYVRPRLAECDEVVSIWREAAMVPSFWLSDEQCGRLQPLLPNKVRGVPRGDDRRGISGIIHVLQSGWRWRDAPPGYGPHKTRYNMVSS